MRYLSVWSGIEPVPVAWQPLGWQPAVFAEINPFCCWLLRSRYRASRPMFMPSQHDAPDRKEAKRRVAAIHNIVALPADGGVINSGGFTKIGKEDVETIDLLAGGTPCQSFSVAGNRAGLDGPRALLTIEFARLADRLRPAWLVWQADASDTSCGPPNLLHSQIAVRRLTPRECERLQRFPDDYTLVEYRGKLAADGPRYKAPTNSMAVPVMRWIGERIAQVDAILREHGNERAV